ncbi:hypothetical protein Tco_0866893 [Tanacetum coccineum]
MDEGITVFLDIPLEVLGRRIADVGTTYLPLLHHGSGGITVFLDIPLEVLGRQIADVGTTSFPLLHHGSGDAYLKSLKASWNRPRSYLNLGTGTDIQEKEQKERQKQTNLSMEWKGQSQKSKPRSPADCTSLGISKALFPGDFY